MPPAGRGALDPHALVYEAMIAVDPQVSPDGRRIAYALARADEARPAETTTSQLWTCALDGSGAAPLTEAGHRHHSPRWSPDGKSIAFVAADDGGSALLVVDAAGGASTTLVRHPLDIDGPAWSPAGDGLAYSVLTDPQEPTAGPDPLVRVTRRLDYKEDGRGYLGDRRVQIFVVARDGGEPGQLTDEPLDHWFPNWSPDGRRLAFQVAENAGLHSWLRLQAVDGSNARDVAFGDHATVSLFAWSPAGDRLLVAADPEGTSQPDLYLVDAAGGATRRLTDDLPVLPAGGHPSSAPPSVPHWLDDRTVLFHGVHRGAGNLYRFDVETRELELLTDWKAAHAGLSVDRGAAHVVQAHSDLSSFGEIAVWDRRSGATTIVSRHNDDLLAGGRSARWERIALERAGFTIESWLFFPPDFDATRRYPLILDVHGGPHGYHGYAFQPEIEVLAAHGYLVLACNPRGSGSYGRAFASAVVRDWGGEDFLDLQASVDLVAARDDVDQERVGIYGYSYGGFMTSWTIGQTDRYKAAVCGAPCFDLVSDYGTSDISPFSDPIEFGGRPWEDAGWYRERSPSTNVHRATTPTLILHGEADTRCPIGQGEQMFAALVQAGCETEFVRYPGASHLFFRGGPEGQRADLLARVLDWFQRLL
ncbi:MAG: alpha/beta fold hydrolase [Candidatus Dormibacteraceae bacterium]